MFSQQSETVTSPPQTAANNLLATKVFDCSPAP